MGFQEDIKQNKGFKSERQKAVLNVIYTEGWLRNRLAEMLKPFDLTGQQYNVLRILRGSDPKPLSTSDIRSRMLDKMSDASRIVERLCKKGLVQRTACSGDKRLVDVRISTKGLKLLSRMDSDIDDFDRLFNGVTKEEAKTLNKLLDKLRT